MIIAYLCSFSVLSDSDMASKFENEVAPANTDMSGNQIAAVVSVIAAVFSVVAVTVANTRRSTGVAKVILALCYLAFVPFLLLTLVTLRLAF